MEGLAEWQRTAKGGADLAILGTTLSTRRIDLNGDVVADLRCLGPSYSDWSLPRS